MQVREELEKLLKIQEFDFLAQKAQRTLKTAPSILKPLQEEVSAVSARVLEIQEKLQKFAKKILDLENAVKSDAIYADTMEVKLPTLISNHKEYHMTAKTIDKLRKLGQDRILEIARLKETQLEEQGRLQEKTALLAEKQQELQAQQLEIQEQVIEAQDDLKKAQTKKDLFKTQVAPQVLWKYERIASAYGHGVGIVKEKRCVSCDVVIPAQTYNLLQRGEEILSCPNCQRLLYIQ